MAILIFHRTPIKFGLPPCLDDWWFPQIPPICFPKKNPGDPICWPRLRPRRLRPNAASTALPALRPHQAGCHGFEAPWTKWSRPAIWGHRNMDFSETLGKKTKSTGENQDDHLPSFLHSHLGLPCSDTATFEIISNPETCKCQSRSRNRCLEMQGIFHGIWTSHRTVTKNSLLKSVETYWSWSLWASFSRKNPSLGLAHAAGGCSARMQTRTRSQLASAKYCNVTAQNDCGANLLQKLRCNSALLYILRKFWECTCICWQLLRSWLQKPLAFAYYKNEKIHLFRPDGCFGFSQPPVLDKSWSHRLSTASRQQAKRWDQRHLDEKVFQKQHLNLRTLCAAQEKLYCCIYIYIS